MIVPQEVQEHTFKPAKYKLPTIGLRYRELSTAMEWGLTPSQFDKLDDNERAEMVAFSMVRKAVESYHYEKACPETEAENRVADRRSRK